MKHLILDMMVKHPKVLNDPSYLSAMLDRLPDILEMERLDGPVMHHVIDGDKSGVTGFQVITTSHCSIHTWPVYGIACVDVFSCYPFDSNKVIAFIEGYLKPFYTKMVEVDRIELPLSS